jgi:Family of unknown function (DUF6541)
MAGTRISSPARLGDEFEAPPPMRRGRLRIPYAFRADLPNEGNAAKWAARGLVAVAIVFNLWTLRAEVLPVAYRSDSAEHLAMVEWASARIEAGHLPFDGWFPSLQLGSAQFHHYQSLPHILTGLLGTVFGSAWSFSVVLYLLLAFWPLAVFWSVRLLGWDSWAAGLAAAMSPLLVSTPGYGFETGSYIWRGWGIWSQLWGMWLLPFAWALTWRALARKGSFALAALAIALTVACHYLTGYLAFLSVGVLVLVKPSEFRRRVVRGFLVVAGAVAAASWVIVPILLDQKWIVQDEYAVGTFYHDSYGARRVLGWLFTGQLFDGTRLPVISMFVLTGAGVCVARWRSDERARVPLVLFALSLLLFFGRPTLGPLLNLVPGGHELFLHRYIMGVHLAGIALAGIGAAWVGRVLFEAARASVPSLRESRVLVGALTIVLLAMLAPAFVERYSYTAQDHQWIQKQRASDATDGGDYTALVNLAQSFGPGRIYSGLRGAWGANYEIGFVPAFAYLVLDGTDSVGFTLRTASLSALIETRFDENDLSQYDMLNVRYLIYPANRQPAVPATRLAQQGRHVLWRVNTSGYVQLVDVVPPPVVADRTNIGRQMESFLGSGLAGRGEYEAVAWAGAPAAPPTVAGAEAPSSSPGAVLKETVDLNDGRVTALVRADRPVAVLLKSSFDPRWQVTVDGVSVETQMFAPSFVGREVSAGVHAVTFTYAPFPRYDLLFTFGILSLLALQLGPAWWRRARASRLGRRTQ